MCSGFRSTVAVYIIKVVQESNIHFSFGQITHKIGENLKNIFCLLLKPWRFVDLHYLVCIYHPHLSHDMTKPTKWVCTRLIWIEAHIGQSNRPPLGLTKVLVIHRSLSQKHQVISPKFGLWKWLSIRGGCKGKFGCKVHVGTCLSFMSYCRSVIWPDTGVQLFIHCVCPCSQFHCF